MTRLFQNPPGELLIATRNSGKIREIEEALAGLPIRLRYLAEFSNVSSVDEVGQTYGENAALKALAYSKQTGIYALADDSGLEVDAMGGAPGVFSARFGGANVSDSVRIEKLLAALSGYPEDQRTARFICCVAMAGLPAEPGHARSDPHILNLAEARCEGVVVTNTRGANGFGFDPLFVPAGHVRTFAELPNEVKNRISHRALALAAMRGFLDRWFSQT